MLSFTINDLLAQARKIGASDLHVAAGAEAKCRVHGELRKITREPLSAADTAELIMPMVPERLRASLDETGEADFSHLPLSLTRLRRLPMEGNIRYSVRLMWMRKHSIFGFLCQIHRMQDIKIIKRPKM